MTKTVLHIITGLGSGGAERMLTRVTSAQYSAQYDENKLKHIVVVMMDEGIYGAKLKAAGIELHCLNMQRGIPSIGALIALIRLLRRHKPDAIMTWLYHATLIGTIATLLALLSPKRIMWNLRGADIDFENATPITRWVVHGLAYLSRLPRVIVSNSKAGLIYHARIGYRSKNWRYIPNGFNLEEWRPHDPDRRNVRQAWQFDDQTIAIGMVARVDPQKDYPTFIAAAQSLPDPDKRLRFVLIGKDTEQLAIPQLLAGRVLALGEQSNVQELLRGLDIAVLSSVFGEGFPNFIGEAMATALPCVVSDVGDSAMLVGSTGLSVPPQNPDCLAQALEKIIDETPAQRKARGQDARDRIEQHYSIETIVALYQTLWVSVSAGRAEKT